MSDIHIAETRQAVGNAHNAVGDRHQREATGLAARIEQLTHWATRDRGLAHVHLEEVSDE